VEGVNGIFYGKGYVLVPMFNFLKVDAILDNIQVNTDFQLIGGSIRTIYDVNNSATVNVTNILGLILSDNKPENNQFPENSLINLEVEIQGVENLKFPENLDEFK